MYHEGVVRSVVFSPDGQLIATASEDNTARVWDARTGEEMARMYHEGIVQVALFSPNGELIATASTDNSVGLWKVSTGERIDHITHRDTANNITFSPDGKYLYSAAKDGTVIQWDIDEHEAHYVYHHNFNVYIILSTSDGEYVVTGTGNRVYIWNTTTNKLVSGIQIDTTLRYASLSPDDRLVVTSEKSGDVYVWPWIISDLIYESCDRLKSIRDVRDKDSDDLKNVCHKS